MNGTLPSNINISDLVKNINIFNYDTGQYQTYNDSDIKYSMQSNQNNVSKTNDLVQYDQNTDKWQEYLDRHYKSTGTRTNMSDIRIPTSKDINKTNMPPVETQNKNSNKVLNPNEISQLTKEDANTTPNLPIKNRNQSNDGESRFYENIRDKTNMLTEEQKGKILDNDEVKYYDKVTNKERL